MWLPETYSDIHRDHLYYFNYTRDSQNHRHVHLKDWLCLQCNLNMRPQLKIRNSWIIIIKILCSHVLSERHSRAAHRGPRGCEGGRRGRPPADRQRDPPRDFGARRDFQHERETHHKFPARSLKVGEYQ